MWPARKPAPPAGEPALPARKPALPARKPAPPARKPAPTAQRPAPASAAVHLRRPRARVLSSLECGRGEVDDRLVFCGPGDPFWGEPLAEPPGARPAPRPTHRATRVASRSAKPLETAQPAAPRRKLGPAPPLRREPALRPAPRRARAQEASATPSSPVRLTWRPPPPGVQFCSGFMCVHPQSRVTPLRVVPFPDRRRWEADEGAPPRGPRRTRGGVKESPASGRRQAEPPSPTAPLLYLEPHHRLPEVNLISRLQCSEHGRQRVSQEWFTACATLPGHTGGATWECVSHGFPSHACGSARYCRRLASA